MNSVSLSGRLSTNVTVNQAGSTKVAWFRIAVNRNYAKKGEKPVTDFLEVKAFGTTADFAANYLEKGKAIELMGSVEVDAYTPKGGTEKVERTFIRADKINFAIGNSAGSTGKKPDAAPVSAPVSAPASAPAYEAAPGEGAPFAAPNFDDLPFGDDDDLPFGG